MTLRVHFLNVGRGDCTIVEFPSGRVGMIDIDNLRVLDSDTQKEILEEYHASTDYLISALLGATPTSDERIVRAKEAELTDPLAYYDLHIGEKKPIFRMMITHPDMDHMTGLYRLHEQEEKPIHNFWHTGLDNFNLDDTSDEEWENCPYDKRDWELYKEFRTSETEPKNIYQYAKNHGQFWTDDGIEIWAPTKHLRDIAVEKNSSNIISMILKISYKGRSIVLGGDATADETWPEIYPATDMKGINVLKASHHGRKTGFYAPAVAEMSPWLTITSVGEAEHDATDKYRKYSTHTVSLRRAGDICIEIGDDGVLYYPPHIEQHWKPKKE